MEVIENGPDTRNYEQIANEIMDIWADFAKANNFPKELRAYELNRMYAGKDRGILINEVAIEVEDQLLRARDPHHYGLGEISGDPIEGVPNENMTKEQQKEFLEIQRKIRNKFK